MTEATASPGLPRQGRQTQPPASGGGMPRWLKILLLVLGGLIALVVVVALGGIAWLSTGSGREFVLDQARKTVPGLTIEGATGSVFDLKAERITLADQKGVWLTAEDVALDWSPMDILTGTLQVNVASAGRVDVARAPVPEDKPEDPDSGPLNIPVNIQVDQLIAERIELGPELLGGNTAVLQASGRADIPAGAPGGTVHLDVKRLDQPGTAVLDATYVPNQNLDLKLGVEEPAGGVIAELLQIPGRPPVTIDLTGTGPLTDWTGKLAARAGDVAYADAEARIRPANGRFTFGLDARANIEALLPPDLAPLVGPELLVGAGGLIDPGNRIALDGVGITTSAGKLVGGGQYLPAEDRINAGFVFEAGEQSSIHQVLPEPVFRTGRAEVQVAGTTQAPEFNVNLDILEPAFREYAAQRLGMNLKAVPQQGDRNRMAVTSRAVLDQPGGQDPALAQALGPQAVLDLDALVRANDRVVEVNRVALDSAGLDASGKATLREWGQQAEAALNLASPDLGAFSGLAGQDLGGALTADVTVNRNGQDLDAKLTADGKALRTGIPAADALLGETTNLAAVVEQRGDADGSPNIRVRDLALTTPRMELKGDAALSDGRVKAEATARIPDLAPLGEALQQPMAGGGTLTLRAEGPTDSMAVTATLDGQGLDIAGRRLGDATVKLDATDVPSAPKGRLEARTSLADQPVQVNADFAKGAERLTLDDLLVQLGENRLTGQVAADLTAGTATGEVTADLPNLSTVGLLAGQQLSGSGSANIRLEAPGGKQAVTVDAALENVVRQVGTEAQRVDRITVDGRATDVNGTPNLDVKLRSQGVVAGPMRLDTVTATAQGPLTKTALALDLKGTTGRPVELTARSTLSVREETTTLALERFNGSIAGTEFRLAQPAKVAFAGEGAVQVDNLALVSGNSRLGVEADITQSKLSGQVELSRVPLAWAQLYDPTLTLDGELNGKATLGGTVKDPRGDLNLRVTRFRLAPEAGGGPSALGATLTGAWRDGRVESNLRVEAEGGGVDLTGAAGLPLILAGGPFAFEVPQDRPVTGNLKGTLELARLNDLLATTGDRIGGRMAVDLRLGGTMAEKDFGGTVRLLDALYENQQWGTTVANINGTLVGSNDGLVIQNLTGSTAGEGKVAATGAIRLDETLGDRQIDLRITADRARVAQTDLLTATSDADITITGDFQNALVAGEVEIRRAEVNIPEQLPAQIVDLEVEEVNVPTASQSPGEAIAEARETVPPPPIAAAGSEGGQNFEGAEGAQAGMVIALKLDVEAENQIYIKGRGVDAEFRADLDVGGTVEQPLVTGQVALVKGELAVLGQTFTINRANLTFIGDGTLEPNLDIEAQTQRGDLTAIVDVEGRPSKPVVKLSSNPALPEDEVLARLLFNRGAGQLSAFEAVQLAQSAAQLTGLLGGGPGIMDRFKKSLGVDRLEIRGAGEGEEGLGTVAAGRYIGRDIYLGVEQELGTGQSRATVEYEITDNIKARGEVGRDSKVGVQFEWDY